MTRPHRQVAVTGFGVVSPAGLGPEPLWQAVLDRRPLYAELQRFEASSYACQVAGEITDDAFDELVHPKKRRNSTRVTRVAIAAAQLALDNARLPDRLYPGDRRGVLLGTALGGWHEGGQQFAVLLERGARRVNPFVANGAPNHTPGVEIATVAGAQGPQLTFSNGCPAGVSALAHAADLVASGILDVAVAGGVECPITPLVFAGMGRTAELAATNGCVASASRPFDVDHHGMVLSEGGCLLVLEDAARARERCATIHALILSSALSCDAAGLYETDPEGAVAAASLARALERAGLATADLDWVCSHANSGIAFDRKEAAVLRRALAGTAADLPVSSIKGVLGHPFAAAGAFQTAAAAWALRDGHIPPTANLVTPDPQCDLHHVADAPLPRPLRHVLVTSYGYGGLNAFLVVGHPDLAA